MVEIIALILFSYLLGSFSTAIVVCKVLKQPDPRTVGSQNPGATNVLRETGKWPALITLLGDAFKGFFPVWLAQHLDLPYAEDEWLLHGVVSGVALATLLGHLFPIYFQFKGGKGVATAVGILLGLDGLLGLVTLGFWIIVISLFRIAAVASVLTCLLLPFTVQWLTPHYLVPVAIISILVICRHHKNIRDLLKKKPG
ncbi:MAG: glycerol-3-phosphate 1-O-acyltransferase PlsY [Gammaproteobacteria bacterium]|nr:glycerol-3-phosphate 1-O-acyltransferase PlsY [Gammaproteobacteria bacterium]